MFRLREGWLTSQENRINFQYYYVRKGADRITKGDEKEFIWNQFYSIIGFSYLNKFNLFNLLTDFYFILRA